MIPLPSQSRLQELFTYDGENLRWAVDHPSVKKGSIAGSIHYNGYRQVKIAKRIYRVHRLIWMLVTGEDPRDLTVDHKDTNPLNNRFDNLRLATSLQQQFNQPGQRGVYKCKRVKGDRWAAMFRHKHLGMFSTEAEARAAYLKAYREAAGDFAHTDR